MRTYTPVSLKVYAHGLARLFDSNWCGEELYDHAKRHYRGRVEPRYMFARTLENGFLSYLGRWLFEDYIETDRWSDEESVEHLLEHLPEEVPGTSEESVFKALQPMREPNGVGREDAPSSRTDEGARCGLPMKGA